MQSLQLTAFLKLFLRKNLKQNLNKMRAHHLKLLFCFEEEISEGLEGFRVTKAKKRWRINFLAGSVLG